MKNWFTVFVALLVCSSLLLVSCTAKKVPSEQSKEFLVKLAKDRIGYLDSLISPFREYGNYAFAKKEEEIKAVKMMLDMFTQSAPGSVDLEDFALHYPESASALDPYQSRLKSLSDDEKIMLYCMMVLQYANGMEFHCLSDYARGTAAVMAIPFPNPVKQGEKVSIKVIPYLSLGNLERDTHPEFMWMDSDAQFQVDQGGATATARVSTQGVLQAGEKEKEVTGKGRVRYPLLNGSYAEIPVSVTYTVVR